MEITPHCIINKSLSFCWFVLSLIFKYSIFIPSIYNVHRINLLHDTFFSESILYQKVDFLSGFLSPLIYLFSPFFPIPYYFTKIKYQTIVLFFFVLLPFAFLFFQILASKFHFRSHRYNIINEVLLKLKILRRFRYFFFVVRFNSLKIFIIFILWKRVYYFVFYQISCSNISFKFFLRFLFIIFKLFLLLI